MSAPSKAVASALLLLLWSSALVVLATPATALVDRDCGDFNSQKAAQLFYLKKGGPKSDPHRLDADDDGIACDSNPCPCYYKKKLPNGGGGATPPPPPVKSSITMGLSRGQAIAGERVKFFVAVAPKIRRQVVLQRKQGARWAKVAAGRTSAKGKITFKQATRAKTTKYRAITAAAKGNGKRYTSAASSPRTVTTLAQTVRLTMPATGTAGDSLTAEVEATPARAGRPVVLQVKKGKKWTSVARGSQSPDGEVSFTVDPAKAGTFRYRAVVLKRAGAAAATSNKEVVRVSAPDVPPASPTALTATPGDGSVQLTWDPVGAADLAGYRVYRRSQAEDWTLLTNTAVTGASYEATGLTNGTQYWFAVTAVDAAGNESARSVQVTATPQAPADTVPPPVPQELTATSGIETVTLTWAGVTASDLRGYHVYVKAPEASGWSPLTSTAIAATSYDVSGLVPGSEYSFAVSSVDQVGNESELSAVVTGVPQGAQVPRQAVPIG